MRIFKNCVEAISEITRDLAEMGTEVHTKTMQDKDISKDDSYVTKELQCYSFCILDTNDKDRIVRNLPWCEAEFEERISRKRLNPGTAWELRKEVWTEFIHDNKFAYTYSERLFKQVNHAISILENDVNSRQCIVQVYDKNIDHGREQKQRIPCSLMYHFMHREGKLDLIYYMRSCDWFTHAKNDVWLAVELRNYIAAKLGLDRGKFFMVISSLHGYKKDMKGVF